MPPSASSASGNANGSRSSSSTRAAKAASSLTADSNGIKLKARSNAGSTDVGTKGNTTSLGLSTTPSRTARARKSTLASSSPLKASSLPSAYPSSSSPAQAHGISLSLSSRSRTDPLSALSTLLRLLRSLPSRIGGCAYKLTPAEHALAVHLVGVLDPFVFRGYRASSLVDGGGDSGVTASPLLLQQPTEILDSVLSHLDSRKDALNLGVTCKRLWEVVSPRHLEYRVVKAKPSNVAVWAHLVRYKDLARNVRRLEVLDERVVLGNTSASLTSSTALVRVPKTLLLSRDTDHDSTDDELALHVKYQKYLCAALARTTSLKSFRWGSGKGGAGGVRLSDIWAALMKHGKNGAVPLLLDEGSTEEEEEESNEDSSEDEEGISNAEAGAPVRRKSKTQLAHARPTNLPEMQTVVFRSTPHAHGAAKQPELGGLVGYCTNASISKFVMSLNLEITYIPPRTPPSAGGAAAAAADDFFSYARLSHLTHLTLNNLRCTSSEAVASFLGAHEALEVLHFDVTVHTGGLVLPRGSLLRLKEVKAAKEVVNAILECPLVAGHEVGREFVDTNGDDKGSNEKKGLLLRPLEVIKGFKLSGSYASSSATSSTNTIGSQSTRTVPDARFLSNLRLQGSTIRRIEMTGWHDMEDVKRVVGCVPSLVWLDVGRKLGGSGSASSGFSGTGAGVQRGPVANLTEWTEVLGRLPELVTVHGVRFFYEVSSAAMGLGYDESDYSTCTTSFNAGSTANANASNTNTNTAASQSQSQSQYHNLSMMERSRMRKNDEIAGVLAWKCRKLRRVDHWEGYENGAGAGKVVVLLREGKEVKWEVRKVRT
ncbi:hypothetical protein CPB84DRAFT_1852537 [Gymnopilus junonius]|uniref:F-box domain-containing protein n=1 Tax=Gymnopilus junonius TaxID=109634 RepID=A0A9P5NBK5_GYMJU|nr:hypothetical protein CPB84DRAFT_1852537 [Gymnopilus junonius]